MSPLDALQLVAGLALLVAAGEALVRGAAALAQQLGVSPLVVGLTVVAFGTSAPELAVNVTAALRGDGGIAFGNIAGSNMANVGLILACAALARPLTVQSIVVTRELPMMLLAAVSALIMASDALRLQAASEIDRSEGLLLLLLFGIFLYYTIAETLQRRASDPFVRQAREQGAGTRLRTLGPNLVLVLGGLVGLAVGGQLSVAGAVGLAESLGVPKALIGLTVVAVGTSLPELSASLLAARRGETDLAVGNVVGSNLFNLLFVMGTTAVLRPVPVPLGGQRDLGVLVLFGLTLLLLALRRGVVSRLGGGFFLAVYLAYVGWRLI